jgi:hypothetical protein
MMITMMITMIITVIFCVKSSLCSSTLNCFLSPFCLIPVVPVGSSNPGVSKRSMDRWNGASNCPHPFPGTYRSSSKKKVSKSYLKNSESLLLLVLSRPKLSFGREGVRSIFCLVLAYAKLVRFFSCSDNTASAPSNSISRSATRTNKNSVPKRQRFTQRDRVIGKRISPGNASNLFDIYPFLRSFVALRSIFKEPLVGSYRSPPSTTPNRRFPEPVFPELVLLKPDICHFYFRK